MATLKYVATLGTGFQKSTISNGGSGYVSGATSIVVADGSVFPATGDFYVGVGDSDPPDFIKICTSRTGNTLTVAAGVVAGSDGNKTDGVTVQWVLPPEGLDQLQSERNRIMTVSAFDALASTEYRNGDRIILSDSIYEVVRDGGAWSYLYGSQIVSRPPSTGWTWDNQDSAVLDSTNGYEYAYFPRSGLGHVSVRHRTAPSTPYFISTGFLWQFGATPPGNNGNNLDMNLGLFFRDSSGELIAYTFGAENTAPALQTWAWTNSTTRTGGAHAQSFTGNIASLILMGAKNPVWLGISDDGTTNLKFWWSIDKQHWHLFDTWARTAILASGPTQVGWGGYNGNSPQWDALIHWNESATIPS